MSDLIFSQSFGPVHCRLLASPYSKLRLFILHLLKLGVLYAEKVGKVYANFSQAKGKKNRTAWENNMGRRCCITIVNEKQQFSKSIKRRKKLHKQKWQKSSLGGSQTSWQWCVTRTAAGQEQKLSGNPRYNPPTPAYAISKIVPMHYKDLYCNQQERWRSERSGEDKLNWLGKLVEGHPRHWQATVASERSLGNSVACQRRVALWLASAYSLETKRIRHVHGTIHSYLLSSTFILFVIFIPWP